MGTRLPRLVHRLMYDETAQKLTMQEVKPLKSCTKINHIYSWKWKCAELKFSGAHNAPRRVRRLVPRLRTLLALVLSGKKKKNDVIGLSSVAACAVEARRLLQ